MRVVFADWRFPFGNRPTKSCQLGSPDHCRMMFAIRDGCRVSNDVDECLHLAQDDLLVYLRRNLGSPVLGAVMYQSVTIPNLASGGSSPTRVFDFRFASVDGRRGDTRLLVRHFKNPKLICSFGGIGCNGGAANSVENESLAR